MTDKEKIKEEIENQRNEYNKIWEITHSDDLESHIAYANKSLLDRLLQFIDSLPEEHNEDFESQYKSNMRYQHAYSQNDLMEIKSEDLEEVADNYAQQHNELLGFDSDCEPIQTGPELKKAVIFGAEWQRNKDAVPSCKNLYDAIKEEEKKKSFHDDFEKASYAQGMIDGSMWQKQQMKETLQTEYEKGRFDVREEMMKDAVDATILDVDSQTIEFGLWPEKLLDIKEGDKVKIIIVK